MAVLITIAKFLGLAMSTVLGIIAIAVKLHEETQVRRIIIIPGEPETEKVRRLTKWGKITLVGIIIGGIIGMSALIFDWINQDRQSRDAQTRTEEQIQLARTSLERIEQQGLLAQNTLDHIQHVVLQFDSMELNTVLETPAFAFNLTNLVSSNEKIVVSNLNSSTSTTFIRTISYTGNPLESRDNTNSYYGEVLGILKDADGKIESTSGILVGKEFNLVKPISLKMLEDSKGKDTVSNHYAEQILRFLRLQKSTLSLWRADSDIADTADFIATGINFKNLDLEYIYPDDQIRITWVCDYPNSNWVHNAKVSSVPDLSHAFLKLSLDDFPVQTNTNTFSPGNNFDVSKNGNMEILEIMCNKIPIFAEPYIDIETNGFDIIAILPEKQDFTPNNLSDFRDHPTSAAKMDYSLRDDRIPRDLHMVTNYVQGKTSIYKIAGEMYFHNKPNSKYNALKALAELNINISKNSTNAESYNKRAYAKMCLSDFHGAEDDLRKATSLSPHFGDAYKNLGILSLSEGMFSNSAAALTKAIYFEQRDKQTYYCRGVAEYELSNYKNSLDDMNQALLQDSNYLDAYVLRSHSKFNLEDYKKAEIDYSQALKLDTNNFEAFHFRGMARMNSGNFSNAISDFNDALRLKPNDSDIYCARAEAKFDIKDYTQAKSDYRAAMEFNPNDSSAYDGLGSVLLNLGDYQNAKNLFETAIKIDKNDEEASLNLALALYQLKNYGQSKDEFSRAIRLNSNNAEAYNFRGDTRVALSDYFGAMLDYNKSIELNPEYMDAYSNRGRIELYLNDSNSSEIDFKKASEIGAKNK